MDSATWCRTPAAASAARRLRPEVSKNSSTALSSNEGELVRSITTCAPAMASLSPSPVMLLTPLCRSQLRYHQPPRGGAVPWLRWLRQHLDEIHETEVRFAHDSPLEGTGFEPLVPRKAPGVLVMSDLARADFPLAENQAEAT